MKLPQFSIATILLITATVGISCGGLLVFPNLVLQHPTGYRWLWSALRLFCLPIPLWLPVLFAAIAIARKSLTLPMVIAFGIAEVIGVAIANWASRNPSLFQ